MTEKKASHPFSFRLSDEDRRALDRLAKHTQRSRANVIKLLIKLAYSDPDTIKKLDRGVFDLDSKGE